MMFETSKHHSTNLKVSLCFKNYNQCTCKANLSSALHKLMHQYVLGAVLVTTSQGFSFEMKELEKSFSRQAEPIPVEVQFISPADEIKPGDTSIQYRAALCGGTYFEGLVAHFAINLANNPWSIQNGDYITVVAKDSAGNTLASNVNVTTKQPQPDFNFTYHAK